MRLLYINGTLVDIDEQTSIGIDFQAYDLKDPSKRKVNTSNNFSIPKTAKNSAIFGHADNPQSIDDTVYTLMTCDYWIDNYHLIKNATVRIEDIGERISLYIAGKNDIWDKLKLLTWSQFVSEYLTWLEDIKGVVIEQNNDNIQTFLSNFITADEDIVLPFYYGNYLTGNLSGLEDSNHIIISDSYWFSDSSITVDSGGHFCIYIKSIVEFIEYKYSINFCTQEAALTGNIWDDTYAKGMYVPCRDIFIKGIVTTPPTDLTGFKLDNASNYSPMGILANPNRASRFYPYDDIQDKQDKTLFDCINSFMQKFNIIQDNIILPNGTEAIRLSRFDDIKTLAPVIDFGSISGTYTFKPTVSGYAQNNIIKYKALFPEASEEYLSKNIVCSNKNIEAKKELFSIDEYIANFKPITGSVIPDLSIQESFKTFQFFITSGTTSNNIYVKYAGSSSEANFDRSALFNMKIPSHYSLANEYLFLEEIINKPKVYTIKKWLSLRDILNITFFAQYYVRELNGSFYINKISGFNPQKSNEPTTIELIRISDKTPTPIYDTENYYTDGSGYIFADGIGNYFY